MKSQGKQPPLRKISSGRLFGEKKAVTASDNNLFKIFKHQFSLIDIAD
ncbi:hypothetical protein [Lactobacillus porci]|nr:hypothetical protein [Lactobacillus porci]